MSGGLWCTILLTIYALPPVFSSHCQHYSSIAALMLHMQFPASFLLYFHFSHHVMLLALYKDSTNGTLECVFIVCLQTSLYTGYTLAHIHRVVLGVWSLGLYTHGRIGHFAVYTVVRYVHYIKD